MATSDGVIYNLRCFVFGVMLVSGSSGLNSRIPALNVALNDLKFSFPKDLFSSFNNNNN